MVLHHTQGDSQDEEDSASEFECHSECDDIGDSSDD